MEIKPRLAYILAFLSAVFLLHELVDWTHSLLATWLCHCRPVRPFDGWGYCVGCLLSGRLQMVVLLAGPLLQYFVIYKGYSLLHPDRTLEERSVGFSMVFLALPLTRILDTLHGRSDITQCLRLMATYNLHHHLQVAIAGFVIVVISLLPPLIRAFLQLPGALGKLLVFPAFFILPCLIDYETVHKGLSLLLEKGFLNHQLFTGVRALVVGWGVLVLLIFLFSCRALATLWHVDEEKVF